MKNSFNCMKVSLMINYIIVVFTIFATVIMFTGIKFMHGFEPLLESTKFGVFRFYTVDSNLLMGISAFLLARQERKLLTGKIKFISPGYYVLKLMGTVSVSLTFVIVFSYLGRIAKGGMMSMMMNSNLFFHLIIPILSILVFTIFEKNDKIRLRHAFLGILPTIIYGICYVINVLLHIENGTVSTKYDWYYFVQKSLNQAFFVVPCIILITIIISLILYFINKKK